MSTRYLILLTHLLLFIMMVYLLLSMVVYINSVPRPLALWCAIWCFWLGNLNFHQGRLLNVLPRPSTIWRIPMVSSFPSQFGIFVCFQFLHSTLPNTPYEHGLLTSDCNFSTLLCLWNILLWNLFIKLKCGVSNVFLYTRKISYIICGVDSFVMWTIGFCQ